MSTIDKYTEESVKKIVSIIEGYADWEKVLEINNSDIEAIRKELESLVSETKKDMAKDIINMLEPLSVKGIVSINGLRLLIEEKYDLTIN